MASFISSIKRKLASILPFPRLNNDHIVAATEIAPSDDDDDGDRPRKRQRRNGYLPLHRHASTASSSSSSSFSAAPHLLVESTRSIPPDFKGRSGHECPPPPATSTSPPSSASPLLRLLPNDALSHCLSYLNTPSDRFGLQVSCRTFRRLSDEEGMLASLELGGCYDRASASASASGGHSRFEDLGDDDDDDDEGEGEDDDDDAAARRGGGAAVVAVAGGLLLPPPRPLPPTTNARPPRRRRAADGGIILERDTSVTAIARLVKFAAAGNMQAIYMIAMISCYCHENLPEGIALLRHAASRDHLPSAYALAIVLRDCRRDESDRCLARASYLGHAPSWQEILTAVEMRARFGSDVDARGLHRYLDPPCLSDLLGRHYLGCRRARARQTSHCWNPMCGRWAYKAPRAGGGGGEEEDDDDDDDGYVENDARRRAGIVGRRAVRNARVVGVVRDDGIDARRRPLGARRGILEPVNDDDDDDVAAAVGKDDDRTFAFSIESLLNDLPGGTSGSGTDIPPPPSEPSPREELLQALRDKSESSVRGLKVSRMKMCSSCRRAKYCSKLCQVYDWRSGKHKMECQFL